jgi:hypothetical protein
MKIQQIYTKCLAQSAYYVYLEFSLEEIKP